MSNNQATLAYSNTIIHPVLNKYLKIFDKTQRRGEVQQQVERVAQEWGEETTRNRH